MKVEILAQGLTDLSKYFDRLPGLTSEAVRIAINDVAKGQGRKLIIAQMLREVAFPSGYLDQNRLAITKTARNDDLTAILTGRQRPTSLARFATSGGKTGPITVRVKANGGGRTFNVKPGGAYAFFVALRGATDGSNTGLAIRVPNGQSVRGRRSGGVKPLSPNVFLLYAPSVDQVFRGVASDLSDQVGALVETEFFRQFDRLMEG